MKSCLTALAIVFGIMIANLSWAASEDKFSVSAGTYSDNSDSTIYTSTVGVTKHISSRFALDIKVGIDAISSATQSRGSSTSGGSGDTGDEDEDEDGEVEDDSVSGGPIDAVTAATSSSGGTSGSGNADVTDKSSESTRVPITVSVIYEEGDDALTLGTYWSFEDTYQGRSVFANYVRSLNMQNTELGIGVSQSFDNWTVSDLDESDRYETQLNLTAMQLLSPRAKMQASYTLTASNGYLASPFRYIETTTGNYLEKLPDERMGNAVALKLITLLDEPTSLHLSYRYYMDDWDIDSHTAEIEVLRDITSRFTVGGRYRYYTQSAASFTKSPDEYTADDRYVAIDYRYSEFAAHTLGMSFIYRPHEFFGSTDRIKLKFSVDAYQTTENDLIKYWYREDSLTAFFSSLSVEYLFK